MLAVYDKYSLKLNFSELQVDKLEDESYEVEISYEDAEELMEQLRVAIALRKDF